MKHWTQDELLKLNHNDHRKAFNSYLAKNIHVRDKQNFLYQWISPQKDEIILECGSSSGKTCIDLSLKSGCRCIGIDFDENAIKISTEMLQKHFPQLNTFCTFEQNDLTTMPFRENISKIIMADFTEHLPDEILVKILNNIRKQIPNVNLYIYTPNRDHVFEILKHKNFILKNSDGHINVKNREELKEMLILNKWILLDDRWRASHYPIIKWMELLLGKLPYIGSFFQRRIVIKTTPVQ